MKNFKKKIANFPDKFWEPENAGTWKMRLLRSKNEVWKSKVCQRSLSQAASAFALQSLCLLFKGMN